MRKEFGGSQEETMDWRVDKVLDLLGRLNLSETGKKNIKLGGAHTLIGMWGDP
jgi:hypothetical protein